MNYGWLFFSFRGRVPRIVFWQFLLVSALVVVLPAAVLLIHFPGMIDEYLLTVALLLLWPSTAIQVKRWHDRNRSAWWLLVGLVPVIGQLWVMIENGFFPGTEGSNRFGIDPLERSRHYAAERHFPANL